MQKKQRSKLTEKRLEQKRKLIEDKGGACEICGYCKNLASLDFHHIDSSQKDGNIGTIINSHRFSDAEKEAEKCQILCKNCHMALHNPHLEIELIEKQVHFKNQDLNALPKKCKLCGDYSGGKKYCSPKCATKDSRKVTRPTKKQLSKLIQTTPFTTIGKKFGVSDNAVRKWARSYHLM